MIKLRHKEINGKFREFSEWISEIKRLWKQDPDDPIDTYSTNNIFLRKHSLTVRVFEHINLITIALSELLNELRIIPE